MILKIDFSSVDGLWIPCNASLSPWNTHFGSEEYEPDARAFAADPTKTFVSSFTKNYYQDANKKGNPYLYGYIPEVSVMANGSTSVVKHYSMGRFSHELSKVMPDERTVYFGDDVNKNFENKKAGLVGYIGGFPSMKDLQTPLQATKSALVPLRAISEAMGAAVEWNNDTHTATIRKDGRTLSITLGQDTAYIDGQAVAMTEKSALVNNKTMIPYQTLLMFLLGLK